MTHPAFQFRFCTPTRTGKWYPSLAAAQRYAAAIGAGFLETRTGMFQAYCHTWLETRAVDQIGALIV